MTLLKPTRRELLALAAAAPAFAMPMSARAMIGAPEGGNPGYFRFTLGDVKLTIVSDGYFTMPIGGVAVNAPEDEKMAFLQSHYLSTTESFSHTNHVHVETPNGSLLIDVGGGNRFFPTEGRVLTNLEAAGIDPYSITHVAMTHAHPDHIWGLRDDFDEPVIPDAEYILGEAEHGYWLQDDLVDRVAPMQQQFVAGAVNSINTEGVDWTLASDGHEVLPGIRMISTPGHTPGHMSLMITSGDESLLVLGDAMTHGWISFAHPGWVNDSDTDHDQTVATRLALLDMAAADRIPVVGYHFPFPGVGHVRRNAGAYEFVPALWQF